MKKLLRAIALPRPAKVCICVLWILVLALIFYCAIGSPTLFFRQEFRRAERANLVGPSRIVDQLGDEYSEFNRMIVGETENGVCFFGEFDLSSSSEWPKVNRGYVFSYREKTGDITIYAAPAIHTLFWDLYAPSLPVYVFDEYPEAVRAELVLTVNGTHTEKVNGQSFTSQFSYTFRETAEREKDGHFLFWLNAKGTSDSRALALISDLSSNEIFYTNENIDVVVPGTVRLYNQQGDLILETDIQIRSVVNEAHIQPR